MTPLVQELWDLEERQSAWTEEEFEAKDHGQARLRRYLYEVLEAIERFVPELQHGYVALSGFQCGWFQPIASLHRSLDSIAPTPTNGKSSALAKHLANTERVALIDQPASDPHFRGDVRTQRRCAISLVKDNECFGFIVLDSSSPSAFDHQLKTLAKAAKVLSRTIAGAVFSLRLRILGAPMQGPNSPLSENGLKIICLELATRTARGFGADGAILRLHERHTDLLEAVAHEGEIVTELLHPRLPSEDIPGRVFSAEGRSWSLVGADVENGEKLRGIRVSRDDIERLAGMGIHSFLVMKLCSYSPRGGSVPIGTLAFMHTRPHHFSWQEVALFQSYCQDVADTVSLYQTNVVLDEAIENVRVQNERLMRVEIMALLVHDLGHKAFHACDSVERYVTACRKAFNQGRNQHPDDSAEKALKTTQEVSATIAQFRQLDREDLPEDERAAGFDLREVIGHVERTLAGALERARVSVRAQYSGATRIRGHKDVLIQVFFNLFINSIDSIRSVKKAKSTIFVHAHADKAVRPPRIVVQFWDDGPGISRQHFPDPRDIFVIGKTSKPGGTGTGLPVARKLLAQYFEGDILLVSSEEARFRIVLPDRSEE